MVYGSIKPKESEVNKNWYPKSNEFSKSHSVAQFKNTSLNTNV